MRRDSHHYIMIMNATVCKKGCYMLCKTVYNTEYGEGISNIVYNDDSIKMVYKVTLACSGNT